MNAATPVAPAADPKAKGKAAAPAPVVPFIRASYEHTELMLDTTLAGITAANQVVTGSAIDVPAYGYARSIVLDVQVTGGTGVAATAKADAPWSLLSEISVQDTNGAQIYGPLSGYSAMLAAKWGGYSAVSDPALSPLFQTVQTNGNFRFLIRIPFEIGRRDALGALPNMTQNAPYKMRVVLGTLTDVYTVNPTGLPTGVRVRAYLEAWAPPAPEGIGGVLQATSPPSAGTLQMWTQNSTNNNSGQQSPKLTRVGNIIRNMIFVFRDGSGVRQAANVPSDITLSMDSRVMFTASTDLLRQYAFERNGDSVTLDTGVVPISFCHDFDGRIGDEMRDLWIPTTSATRLELTNVNLPASGSYQVLVNDVAPAGPYNIN